MMDFAKQLGQPITFGTGSNPFSGPNPFEGSNPFNPIINAPQMQLEQSSLKVDVPEFRPIKKTQEEKKEQL